MRLGDRWRGGKMMAPFVVAAAHSDYTASLNSKPQTLNPLSNFDNLVLQSRNQLTTPLEGGI